MLKHGKGERQKEEGGWVGGKQVSEKSSNWPDDTAHKSQSWDLDPGRSDPKASVLYTSERKIIERREPLLSITLIS